MEEAYDQPIPNPGRIKLKKTKAEEAEKILRQEQKRFEKKQSRINRANGLSTPPPAGRSMTRSISPLPRRPRPAQLYSYTNPGASSSVNNNNNNDGSNNTSEDDDEIQYIGQSRNVRDDPAGPSSGSRRAVNEEKRREAETDSDAAERKRLKEDLVRAERDLEHFKREMERRRREEEQMVVDDDVWQNNMFGNVSYGHAGEAWDRIPGRYAQYHSHLRFAPPPMFSFARREYGGMRFGADGVPSMGGRDMGEFRRHVRDQLEQAERRTRETQEAARRAARKKQERDAYMAEQKRQESLRHAQMRKERKDREAAHAEAQRAAEEARSKHKMKREDGRKMARERYTARWKALTDVGGDIEESEIRYADVPWPMYDVRLEIEKGRVKEFMVDLSKEREGGNVKKMLRETIRAFHPDRFYGRILPRIKDDEREKVREGVEICSRIINALLSEL